MSTMYYRGKLLENHTKEELIVIIKELYFRSQEADTERYRQDAFLRSARVKLRSQDTIQ